MSTNKMSSHTEAVAEARQADTTLPSSRLPTSEGLGWTTMLARTYADPTVAEFSTVPTAAMLVVVATRGRCTVEGRLGRQWERAAYQPGSARISAPQTSCMLRWQVSEQDPARSVHLYLYPQLVDEVSWELGGLGLLQPEDLPNNLAMDDPLVAATGYAVARAIHDRAPAFYADSLATSLAAHMLRSKSGAQPTERRAALDRATLRTIMEYLHENLTEDVTLDKLAGHVTMSKYHLLRSFKNATGTTLHQCLMMLRLRRAAHLLRTTTQSVREVMAAVGYQSMGQFSTAFRREYGWPPGQYRRLSGN
ncbi:AraC family transcriptional regulator [Kibdelosporangium philippinense]|uniref:AraC family transcriptional regulator n=1 Tax=Kibdelosporangium philippinense TaxID=211113 RepID=A0ABS8Z5U6_9PSEU|nr:AraC family transcriptional regulator [Kibdelosporangium philippinense]MCE7003254.1 AraC family transcriptional regulator [Kibdelosporangium philippinense]